MTQENKPKSFSAGRVSLFQRAKQALKSARRIFPGVPSEEELTKAAELGVNLQRLIEQPGWCEIMDHLNARMNELTEQLIESKDGSREPHFRARELKEFREWIGRAIREGKAACEQLERDPD